jgi:predicted nucleotidyltransferase
MGQTLELGSTPVDGASLAEVCRRYGVSELSLFGSAARGEAGPDSDIDIVVEFKPEARVGMVKFELLAEELTRLAGMQGRSRYQARTEPWVRSEVLKDLRVVYAA